MIYSTRLMPDDNDSSRGILTMFLGCGKLTAAAAVYGIFLCPLDIGLHLLDEVVLLPFISISSMSIIQSLSLSEVVSTTEYCNASC
jgi:hypothetical protein